MIIVHETMTLGVHQVTVSQQLVDSGYWWGKHINMINDKCTFIVAHSDSKLTGGVHQPIDGGLSPMNA